MIRVAIAGVCGLVCALAAADAGAQSVPPARRSARPRELQPRDPAPRKSLIGIDTDGWFVAAIPDSATAFNVIDQSWNDLFGTGTGGGGAIGLTFTLREPDNWLELSLAPALSFDSVIFPGETARDLVGGTFTADDMAAPVLLFGPQLRIAVGPHDAPARFLAGADLGIGAVFWPDTGAVLTLPGPPVLTASGDLYDAGLALAWRFTARLGVQWRLSPSFALTTSVFLGVQRLEAPDDVNDPANPFVPADPDPLTPLVVGFAFGLRWRAPGAPAG